MGAGAVGGLIGTRLAVAGVPTSALARGATTDALSRYGWRLREGGRTVTAPCRVDRDAQALGPHDVVVIAVKAQSLSGLAPSLTPLLGPDTVVVPAMNGVPWWFTHGLGGRLEGVGVDAVDPGGVIARVLDPAAVVGCVVHLSASTPSPGLSEHGAGNRLIIGDPSGADHSGVDAVAGLLDAAGFEVDRSERIQTDVWFKLWGNLTMNPISVLTGATMDAILDDPLIEAFIESVMREAAEIGARIGCPIEQSPADRMAVTRRLGSVRTSMLQDADAGRGIELDALVRAVVELGALVDVPTPQTSTLLGLTRLAARTRGLYPA
uniref:2-dehydropantoate 2-reductase n=1 Tax=uncultured Nocardioidaceae bacterium TaxID=253824 RepID=A0A6J4M550_9ACTN|nr:MAG: 2-dehydropantoate 2-reductase [uncultured Nocardioidaceae bacterium]